MPTRGGGFETIYSKAKLVVTVARASFTESNVEQATLDWLEGWDWYLAHGPEYVWCRARRLRDRLC